jgi:hypothetical protein
MEPEELQRLLRQRPFQPFRVHLREGQTYDVRYPKLTLVSRTTLAIGFPDASNPDMADEVVLVTPADIQRVELLPAAAPTSST